MPVEEVLPPGVGRVPLWWMEITPHYVLDEDDIGERRKAEDQMAFYYMQLAAAAEAGVLLPDGTPKLGQDLKPLSWTPITPWNRLDAKSHSEGSSGLGPCGRNFKPGHAVLDPKLFGIMENDPDYQSYLTGAKLPPGYFEKMGELAQSELGGTEGILNNLKQTDYGRYGRQAEAPTFKPAWAKKKLRTTETGGKIRQGQYNDSPNKFVNKQLRRVEATDPMPQIPASSSFESDVLITPSDVRPVADHITPLPATSINEQIKSLRIDSDDVQQQPLMLSSNIASPLSCETTIHADVETAAKKTMVRKVRKVRKAETTPTSAFTAEKIVDAPETEISIVAASTSTSNVTETSLAQQRAELAFLREQQEKLQRLQVLQKQQQLLQEQQAKQRIRQEEELAKTVAPESTIASTDDDEASYEEEIIEDDYSEASYEEEVIYDDDDDDVHGNLELNDLHAILAAKQAELQRLTQQLQ